MNRGRTVTSVDAIGDLGLGYTCGVMDPISSRTSYQVQHTSRVLSFTLRLNSGRPARTSCATQVQEQKAPPCHWTMVSERLSQKRMGVHADRWKTSTQCTHDNEKILSICGTVALPSYHAPLTEPRSPPHHPPPLILAIAQNCTLFCCSCGMAARPECPSIDRNKPHCHNRQRHPKKADSSSVLGPRLRVFIKPSRLVHPAHTAIDRDMVASSRGVGASGVLGTASLKRFGLKELLLNRRSRKFRDIVQRTTACWGVRACLGGNSCTPAVLVDASSEENKRLPQPVVGVL